MMLPPHTARPILRESANECLCTNEDAGALKPYSVLGIQSSWDTDDNVETRRLLKGRKVTAGDLLRWVVTAGAVAEGAVGRVWVMGVCLCQVAGAADEWAKAVAGQTVLTCCGEDDADASAQVLWAASGTGTRLGLIRFPARPAAVAGGGIYRGFTGSPWLGYPYSGDPVTALDVSFDEADLSGCTKIALISNCAAWDTLYDPCSFDLVFDGETDPLIKAAYVEAIGRWGSPYFGTITNYAATLPSAYRLASVTEFSLELLDDYEEGDPPLYPQVDFSLTGFVAW